MTKKLNQDKLSYFDFKKLTGLDSFNLFSQKKIIKYNCYKVRNSAQS